MDHLGRPPPPSLVSFVEPAYRASFRGQRVDEKRCYVARLPTDLQRLIISLVPRRPRMLIVALVCRRWASIVREMLTHLDLRPHLDDDFTAYPELLLLPSVTSLRGLPREKDLIPPNLRQLQIDRRRLRTKKINRRAASFTGLTSLCIKDESLELARYSVATLTHLSAFYGGEEHSRDLRLFTALRSLRMNYGQPPDGSDTRDPMREVLTRLESLETEGYEIIIRHEGLPLTRLTHLSILRPVPQSIDALCMRLPNLNSLEMTFSYYDSPNATLTALAAQPRLPHFLALHFSEWRGADESELFALLQPLTTLRSLSIRGLSLMPERFFSAFPLFTSLRLYNCPSDGDSVPHVPQLRKLAIRRLHVGAEKFLLAWLFKALPKLPKLRKLAIPDLYAQVFQLIGMYPQLEKVVLHMRWSELDEKMAVEAAALEKWTDVQVKGTRRDSMNEHWVPGDYSSMPEDKMLGEEEVDRLDQADEEEEKMYRK